MRATQPIRILIAVGLVLVGALSILFLLLATDTALSIWARLADAPWWTILLYVGILLLVPAVVAVVVWRLLRRPRNTAARQETPELSADALQNELQLRAAQGIDVAGAHQELQTLAGRKATGVLHIALFGEISSGKSTLVNALFDGKPIEPSVLGGTTGEVSHYTVQLNDRDQVYLADLPGTGEADGQGDERAVEEAMRAHVVIYLCDGDLNRDQDRYLQHLLGMDKPVILALNKSDRYSDRELDEIIAHLRHRYAPAVRNVVTMRAGGQEQVTLILPDGGSEQTTNARKPMVAALQDAIQQIVDDDLEKLELLRDRSLFMLARQKLDAAVIAHRAVRTEEIIASYSRKAVYGALAAVTPGSDLVIQGAIAGKLVHDLCRLHDISAREIDIDAFVKSASGKVRTATSVTLAIAGNALKSFPGIGTIAGGLLHAVAYGMIFRSLGAAVANTVADRGEFRPDPAALLFEDKLNEFTSQTAGSIAKLALDIQKKQR